MLFDMWSKEQIEQHKQAADLLYKIVLQTVSFLKRNSNSTEYETKLYIRKLMKDKGLATDKTSPIVAFRENTSFVHYFPEPDAAKKLTPNSLILFDLWASLKDKSAPYADITWMLYFGKKAPKAMEKYFKLVTDSRDEAIKYIKRSLKKRIIPIGKDIDLQVRKFLHQHGQADKFLHGTGHSLGFTYAHGQKTRISPKGKQSLPLNVGYTIEPGIYFKDQFGFRSEIDFYIDENLNFKLTTKVQNKIIIIK